jgi:ATP-dependent helicase HrpB
MLMRARDLGAVDMACDLAAILSERDILKAAPGARDADIRLRTDVMRGGRRQVPGGMNVDDRALAQARQSSLNWQRQFKSAGSRGGGSGSDAPPNIDADDVAGVMLAFAYPDRIGRARADGGRYLLANGRGAAFADAQSLTKSEFIVAAEVDGADREARIYLAAPLQPRAIEKYFANHIETLESITWDTRDHAVKAVRERRLGALTLDSKPIGKPDENAVIAAVIDGIRVEGIGALPWTRDLRQWQARVQLMRGFSNDWPDLSDAALLETLDAWAPQWLSGITRLSHFPRFDLANALRSPLSFAQCAALDRDVPTHFTVPSGSNIPIDYLDGEIPTVSVRLQEMFGLLQTPTIAAGRVPLLLKLLSPAGRPVQITRDLISFWDRGYHEVKKDLKGRYPKHYWPDDPHTAVATRRRSRPR